MFNPCGTGDARRERDRSWMWRILLLGMLFVCLQFIIIIFVAILPHEMCALVRTSPCQHEFKLKKYDVVVSIHFAFRHYRCGANTTDAITEFNVIASQFILIYVVFSLLLRLLLLLLRPFPPFLLDIHNIYISLLVVVLSRTCLFAKSFVVCATTQRQCVWAVCWMYARNANARARATHNSNGE